MASGHHGVVYTKRWVVDMVLDIAGYIPGSGIIDKVVVEPSCGHGAFVAAIAERLADELAEQRRPWSDLMGSVRGYDVDPESIRETRAVVIDTLARRGCPNGIAAEAADTWLACEDFILGEAPACDYVVGNPPYVRSSEIDVEKRELYCRALPSITKSCDLYVSFFDRGINLLREGGALCFICADRWLQNSYGRRLRKRVGSSCDLSALVRMHGVDAFDDEVDAYPAVTLIRRRPARGAVKFVNCSPAFRPEDVAGVTAWLRDPAAPARAGHYEAFELGRPENDDVYPLGNSELVEFVTRARRRLPSLEGAGIRLGIGIATGCDEVFITEEEDLVEPERMLPIFYMRDYRRGHANRKRWLVNPWEADGTLVNLNAYPRLKLYLEGHRERLARRRVAKDKPTAWYRTIDKPTLGLMDSELLLMPDMAAWPDPVLSRGLYPHHNCYWLTSGSWDPHALGGLLMADTTRWFIDALGVKMRGGTLRFQAQYLRLLHIPTYETVGDEARKGLSRAFAEGDREAATRFAMTVYEEAIR